MLKSAPSSIFFLAGGSVGISVGNRVFSKPKGRVDLAYRFTTIPGSHGHPRGQKRPFFYVGHDMPFPAGIRITRMITNIQYVQSTLLQISAA
jgi:hypothetical protein